MGIDGWTLGFQAANFLVLVWLLRRFLYRPVLAVIARRQEEARGILSQASEQLKAAEQTAQARDRERLAQVAAGESVLAEAKARAEAEVERLLAEGRRQVAEEQAAARVRSDAERAAAEAALFGEAGQVAVALARRLLAADGTREASARMLGQALAALQRASASGALGETPDDPPRVRVVSATPLEAQDQGACRSVLRQVLGREPKVDFAVEPALLAGVELELPHGRLRHSWRARLDEAARALAAVDGARAAGEPPR
jgi:F-type H+-transporting ATPase subunit b